VIDRERGYTDYIVGGFGFVILVLLSFFLGGMWIGLFCTTALALEAWTLINKYKEDTISEAIWRLSARPMVPFIFGAMDGMAVLHALTRPAIDPKQIGLLMAIQFLFGHFFFQAQDKLKDVQAAKVERAAMTGVVPEEPK
jgi:hypothetical protein